MAIFSQKEKRKKKGGKSIKNSHISYSAYIYTLDYCTILYKKRMEKKSFFFFVFFILFYRRLYVIENGAADGNVKQLYTAVDSLVFPPHLNNTAAARRELYS